jgi:hypothetical protein
MNVLRIVPHAAVSATVAAGGLLKEDLRCRRTGPLSRRSIFCLSASIFPSVAVSSWRSTARRHSRLPITHTLLYNTRDLGRFEEAGGRLYRRYTMDHLYERSCLLKEDIRCPPGRSDHIRAAPSAPFSSDRVWLHLQQFLLGSHTELRSPRGHGRFAGDRAHHRTLLHNK